MYNAHRNVGLASNPRVGELLESVRQEFETQAARNQEYDQQLTNQVHEMDLVRRKLLDLEQQQIQIKKSYEDELARLRHELETRTGVHHSNAPGPSHAAPPPNLGHGNNTLFGGIMAGQGSGGLAPPPQEPAQQHQSGMGQVPQAPPSLNQPPAPAPAPFGYAQGPANGYPPQPPQPTASPGPAGRGRGGRGAPGPATPQQNTAAPYPGSPQVPRPTPPPRVAQEPLPSFIGPPMVGNTLAELDHDSLPPTLKREGSDWYVVFNPRCRRTLDVDLVHTLQHTSVVCCVRFSLDGRYVATGCNRTAQIFEVESSQCVAVLQDQQVNEDGDLYIRSVCFSPDGKYLATGAEDKVIRVWDIAQRKIKQQFMGHQQDIYSLDYSRNGRLIASGSGDRSVRLWDIESGQETLHLQIDDGVTTVAISPDNRYVAAGSLDKSVRVWDIHGNLVERLEGEPGHKDSVYSVAFAPSGRELVSGSLDKTIKMWELLPPVNRQNRNGRCIRTFEGHKDFVLSVALTPDGQWVLSGSKDRGVHFWDPTTGTAQLMLQGHKNSVISVAPSPVGGLFATGSGDLRARIWKYEGYQGPQPPAYM